MLLEPAADRQVVGHRIKIVNKLIGRMLPRLGQPLLRFGFETSDHIYRGCQELYGPSLRIKDSINRRPAPSTMTSMKGVAVVETRRSPKGLEGIPARN